MRLRLLLDMNIPFSYINLLSQNGYEVLRWSDIGSPTASDDEIMKYAREHDYAILTYDLDFSAILAASRDSLPSVVQIRASIQRANQAVDLISSAIQKNESHLLKGAILSIDLNKSRLRILPL